MSPHRDKINAATDDVTAYLNRIPTPAERARAAGEMLEAAPELPTALREVRQTAVAEMRATGLSFAELGAELGVTRARAKQILDGDSRNPRARRAQAADQ